MMISILAGAAGLLLVLVAAAFVLVRRFLIPPIEVERAPTGLELDARRGALHELAVTVNDRPAVTIEMLPAGPTVLPWSALGFDEQNAPELRQVSITGRTGNRYFQATTSFGRNDHPPSDYASQTWRYIDSRDDNVVGAAPPA